MKDVVYMLECSDGTLYTGWTSDLQKRIEAHSSGQGAKYTRSRLPVKLVFVRECESRSEAMRLEAAIKKMTRAAKLELVAEWLGARNGAIKGESGKIGTDPDGEVSCSADAGPALKESPQLPEDVKFMRAALKLAKKAGSLGEVPIGCVIVRKGKIVSHGLNRRNTHKSTLAHAEITAIDRAGRRLGDWRLEGCTIYITLEPCQMCAGAIVQSRIDRAVIGAMNPKAGCAGSVINILDMPQWNHQVMVTRGVLKDECSALLKHFFKRLRKRLRFERKNGAAHGKNAYV